MTHFALWLALAAGNFLWAAFGPTETSYGDAFERSYFQGVALFLAWLYL